MLSKVRKALDEIRPYLQSDGGDVELLSVIDGVATVRLQGHCVGCPMSTQTLKNGIEKHLMASVPEIVRVCQEGEEPLKNFAGAQLQAKTICPIKKRVTEGLRADHQAVGRQLEILNGALRQITNASSPKRSREALNIVEQTRKYLATDFLAHMRLEEKVLFPALKPLLAWGDPLNAMEMEHRELQKGIEALNQAIIAWEFGGANTLPGVAGTLINAIRNHLHREENVIFFEADELLAKNSL